MALFTLKAFRILSVVACFAMLGVPAILEAQGLDSIPMSNHDQFILRSKLLNEDRSIWVHTPADYKSSNISYPVLYLLDGGKHFTYANEIVDYLSDFEQPYISPMIVVAIPNVDRGRDLTPVLNDKKEISKDSGAATFLQFLKTELIPEIEKKYRTAPYRVLEGHSLGGLFSVYANVAEPDLFQASIIISPALTGSETAEKVMAGFTGFLKSGSKLKRKFFITLGEEKTESLDLITQQLNYFAPQNFKWNYIPYLGENHFSVPFKSIYDGLRYVYSDWYMDLFLNKKKISWKEIDQHLQKMSGEFGYPVHLSEDFVNQAGYQQLDAGNMTEAISIFQQNIKDHPKSWNAFDSMGEAYMRAGNTKMAIDNYKRSLQLNPANNGARNMLKKLKSA